MVSRFFCIQTISVDSKVSVYFSLFDDEDLALKAAHDLVSNGKYVHCIVKRVALVK